MTRSLMDVIQMLGTHHLMEYHYLCYIELLFFKTQLLLVFLLNQELMSIAQQDLLALTWENVHHHYTWHVGMV